MKLKLRSPLVFSILSLLAGAASSSADTNPYSVQKTALTIQTSATPVASPKFPYSFEAQATTSATLTLPGGATQVIPFDAGGGSYDLFSAFTSKVALDAAYPDGTYQESGSGIPTLSLALTPDSYPSVVPAVTNVTFSNGVFYINPAANVTLNFSAFPDYHTVGVISHEGMSLQDQSGGGAAVKQDILSVANPFGIPVSVTPFGSYAISAGSLVSGDIYELDLTYETGQTFNTTAIPGNAAVSIFSIRTVAYCVALASSPSAPPIIATDLASQSGFTGGTVTLSAAVTVGGSPPTGALVSLWYFNGNQINIDGVKYVNTGTSMAIHTLATADAGVYFVKFITQGGLAVSANATVTVLAAGTPPTINSTSGTTGTVAAGTALNLSVTASESGYPLTYQWQLNGANISGATGTSYALASVTSGNAGDYSVIVSNGSTTASHDFGTLTVQVAGIPVFTVNPVPVNIAAGHSAVFSVSATNGPTYQWKLNNAPVSGATDPILQVPNALVANAGTYTCTATNSGGSVTSAGAALTVTATSNAGRLINLSARAYVGTGNNILIGGFGVTGTGTKQLLVRGVGPALSAYFSTELVTPQLVMLDNSGAVIATNIGWGNAPVAGPSTASEAPADATTNLMNSLGAQMIAPGSGDTAIVLTMPAGNNTAQISGVGATSGIALCEIYDADTATPPNARLINISARADVGTGNNILIGGFAVSGATAETVLIRAVGPGLNDELPGVFPLSVVLNQPVLSILDHTGAVIYSNTVWGGDATIAGTFATTGAFSLNSAHADSVVLASLPPGNYTAQVSGLNSGSGIALCEIYEVP